MRNTLAAMTFCLVAATAEAASPLHGIWEITMPSDPTLSGEMIFDGEGRVRCTAVSTATPDNGCRARGYVSILTESKIEITMTGGKTVWRVRCAIQSKDILNCDAAGNAVSGMFFMRRIGPGPASLVAK